jgi:hypothetical protein
MVYLPAEQALRSDTEHLRLNFLYDFVLLSSFLELFTETAFDAVLDGF